MVPKLIARPCHQHANTVVFLYTKIGGALEIFRSTAGWLASALRNRAEQERQFSADSARPDRCRTASLVIRFFRTLSDRHERGPVGDLELPKDGMKMHFDGAVRDLQPSGDLLIR